MIARRLRWPPDARRMVRQLTGAWAGVMCAGLVAAGFLMVAGHPASQNVFMLYADYARSFFSGSSAILY